MNRSEIITSLKNITSQTNSEFLSRLDNLSDLKGFKKEQVQRAAINADFSGVQEDSEEFFKLLEFAEQYNALVRDNIRQALLKGELVVSQFELVLLLHALDISDAYFPYYRKWLISMIASPAAKFIKKELEANPEKLHDFIERHGMESPYTVIHVNEGEVEASYDTLTHTPFALYFIDEVEEIVRIFDRFIDGTSAMNLNTEERATLRFMKAYRNAIAETHLPSLEVAWETVDYLWMETSSWIEVVHEMESHYGDPLGLKVIPDFSVRFLDESFAETQNLFAESKALLEAYYKARNTPQSETGIKALTNSKAGIYYLPFNTGMSMHFKFSGQSIPNRTEVKLKQGVKIFLDYQSTSMRTEKAKELFSKIFGQIHEPEVQYIKTDDQLINHVVPHEFGHTIYNFVDFIPDVPNVYAQNLEELRADLNALAMMFVKREKEELSDSQMHETIVGYIAHELRRFALWSSSSIRPYRYSMQRIFAILAKLGILSVKEETVNLTLTKDLEVQFLKACYAELNMIHDLLDKKDNASLHKYLDEIIAFEKDPICTTILAKLDAKHE